MQKRALLKTAFLGISLSVASFAAPYITVKNISFNWDKAATTYDAINIRKDFSTAISVPEYTGTSSSSVCAYKKGITPRIRVQFTVTTTTTTSLKIRGISDDSNGVLATTVDKTVTFTNGVSPVVEFVLGGSIPSKVYKSAEYFKWTIVQSSGNITCQRTGPHAVYVVLGDAGSPWSTVDGSVNNPWVSALDFSIDASKGAMTGKSTTKAATAAITSYLYSKHGLKYDTISGTARYMQDAFMLTKYISKTLGSVVNCYDQAAAVVTFSNLIGGSAYYVYLSPFGYLNPTYLTGISRNCNNPFFGKYTSGTYSKPLVGLDDINRTKFGNHAVASLDGYIFDACAGPYPGSLNITSYYNTTADMSTAAEKAVATAFEDGYEYNDISDVQ